MKPKRFLASLLAATLLAGFAAPVRAQDDGENAADWTQYHALSDRGGHVMGNPQAPVKLVEYASYTCSHCAAFETTEAPQIKSLEVATGGVSFELRNLIRDGVDLTVAVLARCGGKDKFFANHKYWMQSQGHWMAYTGKISNATNGFLDKGNLTGYLLGVYADMKLATFAANTGLDDKAARACLANPFMQSVILEMSDEATETMNINATPTVLVNGIVAPGYYYSAIKPLITQK